MTVDKALKNAQKTLFESLKVAKIEHVIIQQLINQVERARVNLSLTNETSVIIEQVQISKSFEFASIDLIKKSSIDSSINKSKTNAETISENFLQLEKSLEEKIKIMIK